MMKLLVIPHVRVVCPFCEAIKPKEEKTRIIKSGAITIVRRVYVCRECKKRFQTSEKNR